MKVSDGVEWGEMCMTYRTPRFAYLRRPYLSSGDTHLLVLSQLHGIDDLVVVRTDVPDHLLILSVLPKKPFHLSCNKISFMFKLGNVNSSILM